MRNPELYCPDCRAFMGYGGTDFVLYGSPLHHHSIYDDIPDPLRRYVARPCPTGLARELQIQTDVFGGERVHIRYRNRHAGAFVPDWPGETLPPVAERRYMQTRSFA
jgi:hypothetical protein